MYTAACLHAGWVSLAFSKHTHHYYSFLGVLESNIYIFIGGFDFLSFLSSLYFFGGALFNCK